MITFLDINDALVTNIKSKCPIAPIETNGGLVPLYRMVLSQEAIESLKKDAYDGVWEAAREALEHYRKLDPKHPIFINGLILYNRTVIACESEPRFVPMFVGDGI